MNLLSLWVWPEAGFGVQYFLRQLLVWVFIPTYCEKNSLVLLCCWFFDWQVWLKFRTASGLVLWGWWVTCKVTKLFGFVWGQCITGFFSSYLSWGLLGYNSTLGLWHDVCAKKLRCILVFNGWKYQWLTLTGVIPLW